MSFRRSSVSSRIVFLTISSDASFDMLLCAAVIRHIRHPGTISGGLPTLPKLGSAKLFTIRSTSNPQHQRVRGTSGFAAGESVASRNLQHQRVRGRRNCSALARGDGQSTIPTQKRLLSLQGFLMRSEHIANNFVNASITLLCNRRTGCGRRRSTQLQTWCR